MDSLAVSASKHCFNHLELSTVRIMTSSVAFEGIVTTGANITLLTIHTHTPSAGSSVCSQPSVVCMVVQAICAHTSRSSHCKLHSSVCIGQPHTFACRDALSATKTAAKELQSKATSLQQQLHDLQQEEEGGSSARGLIKQVKTLQVDSAQQLWRRTYMLQYTSLSMLAVSPCDCCLPRSATMVRRKSSHLRHQY